MQFYTDAGACFRWSKTAPGLKGGKRAASEEIKKLRGRFRDAIVLPISFARPDERMMAFQQVTVSARPGIINLRFSRKEEKKEVRTGDWNSSGVREVGWLGSFPAFSPSRRENVDKCGARRRCGVPLGDTLLVRVAVSILVSFLDRFNCTRLHNTDLFAA